MARSVMAVGVAVALLGLLAPAAPVAADGMPAYELGTEDPEEAFGSLFESRQLARVDLVNDTHERISLFLSVFSLDPGKNLTIMVPLRTLPADVTGASMKESEFREGYKLDRIEDEVVRQDPDEAWGLLRDEVAGSLEGCFGSMLMTLPGEYIRENYHIVTDDSGRTGEDKSAGGGEFAWEEPEPVQHYEFDGFSIDVFGVGAGPRLSEYLAEKGLVMPTIGELMRYNAHYIAVVEGATKPPIDPEDFALIKKWAPNTSAQLGQKLRDANVRTADDIWYLQYRLADQAASEMRAAWGSDYYYSGMPWSEVDDAIYALVDAVYGATDFEGEVLSIELPLDGGKVFFPLGTSAGWPNLVGDIAVLFRVPEGKDLSVPSTRDAFFDGGHWYLFELSQANPDYDLESAVKEGSSARASEAARAAFVTDNAGLLGGLAAAVAVLLAWFGSAAVLRRRWGLGGATVRDWRAWVMLGAALVLSVPGAVLAYLLVVPTAGRDPARCGVLLATLAAYPVAAVLFVAGVLL